MSDVKISALPTASSLSVTDLGVTVQGGVTKQFDYQKVVDLVSSNIDLTPFFKKDGTVAMTGHANWGGKNITNFGTLFSGNTNVIQNTTNANNYLQVASAGVVLNSNGEVTVQTTALNVTTGSNKGQFKTDGLTGDRTYQFPDYDFAFPTSAPGSNTYLKWNGSSYVWATAGGGTTTNALSVDNSSLQLDSGTTFDGSAAKTISVKALGITNAMLAGSIAASKLVGTDISTVGTITSGTWNGTAIADSYISSAATWNAKFTLPSLTSGSILFSNGTTISQDNSNLFYDSTNHRLGLGTTSPASMLHLSDSSTSTVRGLVMDNSSVSASSAKYYTRKSRSGGVITTGDVLGNWTAAGHDGTSYTDAADIRILSTGTISTGIVAGQVIVRTANTSGTLTQALLIDKDQSATFAAGVSSVSHSITGTGGNGNISLTAQSSAPTLSAGDTKMYVYADSSTRFSLAKRNAADSATITRTFVFNDASVTYTFPSTNTDTLAGLGTAQSWTAQQTFTGSAVQMPSLQLLDTTYKTAVDVSSANTVRIGQGFGTVTLAPGGTQVVSMSATVLTISKVTNITGGLTNTGGQFTSTFNNTTSAGANSVIAELTGTYQLAASGAGSYTALLIDPTVNLTSASNTPVTLININPTLTSLTASNTIYGIRSQIASGTGTRWNIYADGTASNYIAGNTGIGTSSLGTAFLTIAASTTAKAAMNFISGTAPTSPNNGDFWFDGTNFKAQVGGVTKTFTIT
jgi:hypothetical protein